MSSHNFQREFATREVSPIFHIALFHIALACFLGIGLGLLMGYQLKEQTTPAAEVAQMAASNKAKISQLEHWRDIHMRVPIVIKPTEICK